MRFFCNFWGSYVKTNDTIRFLSQKLVKIDTLFVHIYKIEKFDIFRPDLDLTFAENF